MRASSLVVLALVSLVACGGASATGLGGDAQAGDSGGSPDVHQGGGDDGSPRDGALDSEGPADGAPGAEAGTKGDAGHADAGRDAPSEACAPTLLHRDDDGDGYGGSITSTGCPPDSGHWVTVGGDCDDDNPDVHPGQVAYFATGYVAPGQTAVSFDYNCDGQETESGNAPKLDCQPSTLSCTGDGYIPASPARSGTGVDPYCGSDQDETCTLVGLSCTASAPQQASAIACH